MRQAVILVGGRGSRLGQLASDLPKPLVSIAGDMRFLDYLLLDLARHGFAEILLLAGHLAAAVERRYDGKRVAGARIRVIAEPKPAGTAGALRFAEHLLDDVFLMSNGDSLLKMNYLALAEVLGQSDVGAMALRRVGNASRFGRVELDGDRITAFIEKDTAHHGPALISAGVCVLRRRVVELIGEPPQSIETDVFPRLAATGALAGRAFDGFFIDIGLPETLSEARRTLPKHMRRGAVFFDRDGTLIVDEGYTYKPEALRWQPGAIETVRRCNDAGFLAIVITNQSGVARGLYTEDDVRAFHARMQDELREHGAHIDAFYHCPYHGDGVVPEFAHADHPDRKPNAGLLRRALAEWPIDSTRCFLVGDSDLDVAAARAARLPSARVKPGELLSTVLSGLQTPAMSTMPPRQTNPLRDRAARARSWLFDHALPLWWHHGFDNVAQCFHERLALDGSPLQSLDRRIRVQARQTVVYARAGKLGWNGPWHDAVQAGAHLLLERALRVDGGTRHKLASDGRPLDDRRDLYDLAFVVFALAEAGVALARNELLSAADSLADWAYEHWAHSEGGLREGDVTPTPPRRQNPHMHMFEALLALFEATNDKKHLERANGIAALFAGRLFDERFGALREYYDDAWHPRLGDEGKICEPGHHFEWSWLLHRWNALGGGDLGEQAERLRVHGELYGVDHASGAVYDEIFVDGRARTETSRLWPHTERLKANVVRYERSHDPRAAENAAQAFDVLMRFCEVPMKGLWRDRLLLDKTFIEEAAPASSFYHITLALSELIRISRD
jgi:D,D-heptose 1,7-bisphosphate phosphatase